MERRDMYRTATSSKGVGRNGPLFESNKMSCYCTCIRIKECLGGFNVAFACKGMIWNHTLWIRNGMRWFEITPCKMGWVETTPLVQDANVRSVETDLYKFRHGCPMYCGFLSALNHGTDNLAPRQWYLIVRCCCFAPYQSESNYVPLLQWQFSRSIGNAMTEVCSKDFVQWRSVDIGKSASKIRAWFATMQSVLLPQNR